MTLTRGRIGRSHNTKPKDCIVIVHGYAGTLCEFFPLKWRLESKEYNVCIWGFNTILRNDQAFAKKLENKIIKLVSKKRVGKIHFVGYLCGANIVDLSLPNLQLGLAPWQRGGIVYINPTKARTPNSSPITPEKQFANICLNHKFRKATIITTKKRPPPFETSRKLKVINCSPWWALYSKEVSLNILNFLAKDCFYKEKLIN
jgi:hypothetical protein